MRDENKFWRIICRLDSDAIVIAGVFSKTTRETPKHVIEECKRRISVYDQAAKTADKMKHR